MAEPKIRRIGRRLRGGLACGLLLFAVGGLACNSGGGSSDSKKTSPSAGSDWDKMHWDKGQWD